MAKLVTMQFQFADEEYEDFLASDLLMNGQISLRAYVFGELCQNQGFGFLTNLTVEDVDA